MNAHAMIIAGVFIALPTGVQGQTVEFEDGSCFTRVASYSSEHLKKAVANFGEGLKSQNDGVVECVIAYSTYLRVGAPELDLSDIGVQIAALVRSGRTAAIRYKAYLATVVFEDPRAFEHALVVVGGDGNRFFGKVGEHVSRTLLGYKIEQTLP